MTIEQARKIADDSTSVATKHIASLSDRPQTILVISVVGFTDDIDGVFTTTANVITNARKMEDLNNMKRTMNVALADLRRDIFHPSVKEATK